MTCCTFKLLFMADPNNSKTKSHHLITQTRNSQAPIQYHFSMIPLKRNNLSTRIFCPRPPLFSLLKELGNPSLAQCLFSSSSSYDSADTHDDDDHHHHHHDQNKDSRKKINIEAQEEGKDSVSNFSEPPLEAALVKVTCKKPSYWGPGRYRCAAYFSVRNGFIIEGRRLLTCAHCIQDHTVKVEKQGSDKTYLAKVIAIANEFDLAMLAIRDDEFWEGVRPVEFGDMPSLGDELTTMDYSGGMDTITSRNGYVIDVGMIPFSDGALKLPAFAVCYDSKFWKYGSAIFNENRKCVGMAFDAPKSIYQRLVIPATIIKHFIEDYDRNGGFTGSKLENSLTTRVVPIFGVKWQKMENHSLRMLMGMQHDQEGVRIIDVDIGCPTFEVLWPDDVILSIDGVKIANDGTVPFGPRVDLNYLFTQKSMGDNVHVKVLRDSKIHEFNIELVTPKQFVPGGVKGIPLN